MRACICKHTRENKQINNYITLIQSVNWLNIEWETIVSLFAGLHLDNGGELHASLKLALS
jgi:hypothetical protein